MKKILILTVTAGNGHNACARGMKNKLEKIGGVEVKVVDLLKSYSSKLNVWVADKGYAISVSKFLPLYNAFYDYYKRMDPERRYAVPSQKTVVSTAEGLMREILEFQPDVIYSTHFYGAIALTDIKLAYGLPCKTVVSNLDYVNSPFWEAGIGVDYFAIPNEDFIEECLAEGYRREQLLPMGLPVDERTLECVEKAEARRRIGLEEDVFTVMVMFGGGYWSGGVKIFKNLIKALQGRRAQVIMINGRNERGYRQVERVRAAEGLKILNVGFTDQVPLYLSAADVIINKFGGTSVTEMINKTLPMLITERTAAQERYNLEYMKQKGVALSCKNEKELREQILMLMDNPERLREMSKKTSSQRKNAINDLANFMLSLPNADYSQMEKEEIELGDVKKSVEKALREANQSARTERRKTRFSDGGGANYLIPPAFGRRIKVSPRNAVSAAA